MNIVKAGDDIFFTMTMAEILEKQGYLEDALMIYKILSNGSPDDEALAGRITRLKCLAEKGRGRKTGA